MKFLFGEVNMTDTKKASPSTGTGYGATRVTGKIKKLLFGGLSGFAVAVLLLLTFSAIFALSSIPDGLMEIFTYLAVALASITAGFISLRLIGADGLVNGLIAGAVFFIIHVALGAIMGDEGIIQYLIYGALELPMGALGGVISVNLRKS
jgi:putative membrane protein (TIGR04086 family)